MAHCVSGIIVKESDAKEVANIIPFKQHFSLSQGFAIFPISDELIEQSMKGVQQFKYKEFTYLTGKLSDFLLKASKVGPIIYIETDYFGGEGEQSAIAFADGRVVFGPMKDEFGPINQALKSIGVKFRVGFHDEFEYVGLANIRSIEDLLNSIE